VLVGTTAAYNISGTTSSALQVAAAGGGGVNISRFSANAFSGILGFIKSRGASLGTNTVVVSGDTLGQIAFGGADGTNYINAAHISAQVDGTPGTNDMPGRLVFSTTADGASTVTERMRITSAGNVGIGVQIPPVKLVISKSGGCAFRIIDESTNYWELRNDSNLIFDRGGSEKMRINSSGNVGIGTSSPSDKLTVISAGTQVGSTNFRNIARIGLATNDASVLLGYDVSAGSAILASTNNFPLAFWTSNAGTYAEKMRIDSSGNVGIGTSSPSVLLSVSKDGGSGDAGQLGRFTDTNTANSVGPTSLTIGMMNHFAASPRMSIAGTTGLSFCVGDGSDFGTQRKVDIDSSGNLLVGVTSATSGGGVLQVSNGITFPATQSASSNANTLDDYEEGTWTPTDGSGAGLSFTVNSATYTKIGNTVRVSFYGSYPTTATRTKMSRPNPRSHSPDMEDATNHST
jgi:hypothetical protein